MNADLVAGLLSWAGLLLQVPPGAAPDVQVIPQAQLAHLVCGQPCPALGLYASDGRVYLADTVDLESMEGRSILLHELVHHLQQRIAGGVARDCEEALRREREAFLLQAEFLMRNGSSPPVDLLRRTVPCQASGSTGRP